MTFRITALPDAGTLYQVEDGVRGPAITAPNTAVTDLLGRVLFRPAPDRFGDSYASFRFIANDGELDSPPATVTISVTPLPLAPEIDPNGWSPDNGFALRFSGWTTNTYRIWVSTNLLDWRALGSAVQTEPARFEFRDPATGDPARFYKVSHP